MSQPSESAQCASQQAPDDELDSLLERCTFEASFKARLEGSLDDTLDDSSEGAARGDGAPAEQTRLVCAVSGGADSAALLALACRFARRSGAVVAAIHADHGIRAEGPAEAAKVEALCTQLGSELAVVRLGLTAGPNSQARARAARRAAFGPNVLLGHTADDQAETVLLQLLRGGALDALAAMRADRRPLLRLRRRDTERVCELIGYEPIRDPSNADPRFWRSRVRHELIPLMCDIAERDVVPLLARAADLAAGDAAVLDAQAAQLDPTSAAQLRNAPVPLARRAVRAWLRDEHPPDAAAVERVLDVARQVHRATETGGGRRVVRSGDRLRLVHGLGTGEQPGDQPGS